MTPDAPTGALPAPHVTAVRGTVKVPTSRGRFTVHTAGWHPELGWGCTCESNTRTRPCDHVTAVIEAITPKAGT